jgi:hypothetical protein
MFVFMLSVAHTWGERWRCPEVVYEFASSKCAFSMNAFAGAYVLHDLRSARGGSSLSPGCHQPLLPWHRVDDHPLPLVLAQTVAALVHLRVCVVLLQST